MQFNPMSWSGSNADGRDHEVEARESEFGDEVGNFKEG